MAEVAVAGVAGLAKGTTIGRYVVLGLIGRGGMGEVYAAFDPELDRKIAIKLLRAGPSRAGDLEGRVRLLREAQAIAKLSHPNVVIVYDVGTFEDQVFIAMEFVDGNTVGYWMKAAERPWRETLDIFVAAGRGLAAAHAAGMVHRDFKPDNVMITRDGQVRVMDFGLARQLGDREPARPDLTASGRMSELAALGEEPAPAPEVDLDATAKLGPGPARAAPQSTSGNYLRQQLTLTGAMVGTPAYMSPEQFGGQATDARTDQFSFCVALYEAFYGYRPYEGNDVVSLMANVISGTIKEPPARIDVPASIHKVLLQGLQPDPEHRHASMAELLAGLAPQRRTGPRPWVVGLALAALGASAFMVARNSTSRADVLCGGASARLAGVWELGGPSSRKDRIRSVFEAGGKGGGQVFVGLSSVLDGYVQRWTSAYRDACEATHVRGEQSAEVLDLRMACLNERLASVKALTDIFSSTRPLVAESAVDAAAALPSLERCSDATMLRAVIPPPADHKTRERVEALRSDIARARALGDAGQCTDAQAAAAAALAAAKQVAYLPLEAEASYVVGRLGNVCNSTAAIGVLEEAVWAAETSRHDEVAVMASSFAGGLYADQLRDLRTARRWLRYSDAILGRLPGHRLLRAYTDVSWGVVLQAEGDDQAALEKQQHALAFKEEVLGPMHPDTALSAMNVGLAYHELQRDAEAEPHARRALETFEKLLGPASAKVAIASLDLGEILTSLGRLPEAQAALQRAVGIWEREGASPFFIALGRLDLARVELASNRPAEAQRLLEGQIEIIAKVDPIAGGQAKALQAMTLWASPRDRHRARPLVERARAELVAAGAPAKRLAEIDSWLKEHVTP